MAPKRRKSKWARGIVQSSRPMNRPTKFKIKEEKESEPAPMLDQNDKGQDIKFNPGTSREVDPPAQGLLPGLTGNGELPMNRLRKSKIKQEKASESAPMLDQNDKGQDIKAIPGPSRAVDPPAQGLLPGDPAAPLQPAAPGDPPPPNIKICSLCLNRSPTPTRQEINIMVPSHLIKPLGFAKRDPKH